MVLKLTTKKALIESWQKLALAGLLVFVGLNNMAWYCLGGSPLHWDDSLHLTESLEANRILAAAGVPHKYLMHFSWIYPPLVSWSTIPFYAIFGEGGFAASLTMSAFLAVLLLSTYGLGRHLFDENVGLLSSFFVSASPIVMDFSRQFMLDMPLAAMTVLSLYLLVRTEEFDSIRWSLLLGIGLGCGMLTKWTFPFFLIYPFLFTAIMVFLKGGDKIRRLRNLSLCILIACAVSFPWYWEHFISFLIFRSHALVQGNRSILGSILYYVLALPGQTSWLLLSALAMGIALYVRQFGLKHLVPILSVVGGYLLLTMVILKVERFSIPLLPPLTVLACAGIIGWVMSDGHPNAKRVQLLFVYCIVVILQYTAITYIKSDSQIGKVLSGPMMSVAVAPVHGATKCNWQQADILRTIADDSSHVHSIRQHLRVVPEHVFFNWESFEYVATLNRLPVTIETVIGFPQRVDYTVLKTGELGEDVAKRQEVTDAIVSDTSGYEFLRRFPLPDGSSAILLRTRVGRKQ